MLRNTLFAFLVLLTIENDCFGAPTITQIINDSKKEIIWAFWNTLNPPAFYDGMHLKAGKIMELDYTWDVGSELTLFDGTTGFLGRGGASIFVLENKSDTIDQSDIWDNNWENIAVKIDKKGKVSFIEAKAKIYYIRSRGNCSEIIPGQ